MTRKQKAEILLRGLVRPSDWTNPGPAANLRVILEKYFSLPAYPVNSGRSAIYLALKAAGVGQGDEVLIQAYTCNAVPNPIIWAGAKPIFVDINPQTLNIDPNDLKNKITKRTKIIILQHTFGRPGPVEEVMEIARNNHLLVMEDCAHSLGAEYKGKKLGTFGDVAILSFGREKVISSLAGGAVLIRNEKLIKPLENLVKNLGYTPYTDYLKELNNFFVWRIFIRRVFFTEFGQKILKNLNKTEGFNVVYSKKELVGERPGKYPASFPGPLAQIVVNEFEGIDEINKNRNKIASYYAETINNNFFKLLSHHNGVYLRFVVLYQNPEKVFSKARERKYWFGDWYSYPVYPKGTNLDKMGYQIGSCPNAEAAARQTINLPVFKGMNQNQAKEIVDFINNFK